MQTIKQWLSTGVAFIFITTGIALGGYVLLDLPFLSNLLLPLLLCAGIVLLLTTSVLWFAQMLPNQPAKQPSTQHRRLLRSGHPPVRLAKLQFRLDDPHNPRSFQLFLGQFFLFRDDPLTLGNHQTPLQAIERTLKHYVQQLEQTHQGRLAVDIRIKRGSLTVVLTFLAVYEFLAQYHDFIESIRLIQRQVNGLTQEAVQWYYQATGRKLEVQADVVINAHTKVAAKARRTRAATYASQVEKATPPTAHSEVRINIYGLSFPALLLACLVMVMVVIVFAVIVAALGCILFGEHKVCTQLGEEIVSWAAQFFIFNH